MLTESIKTTITALAREIDFIKYYYHPPPDNKAAFVEDLISLEDGKFSDRLIQFTSPIPNRCKSSYERQLSLGLGYS